MGLISKTAITKWAKKNKKWYTSKGYKFTKYRDEPIVSVEDLLNTSQALVEVTCDGENCSKIKIMKWEFFKKGVKEDGKYYCQKCIKKVISSKKSYNTKLKNSKSFEKWCIDNNRQDVLDRWDYELNNYEPSEISYASHKKCWFKCPRGIHESELKNIHNYVLGQGTVDCFKCNTIGQFLIDNYGENAINEYWGFNNKNPFNILIHSKQIIEIKCQEKDYHGFYSIRGYDFANGRRCPFCGNHKVHPLDSLGAIYPQVLEIWSDKNEKSPFEYSPKSQQKVWWKCLEGEHEDYKRNIHHSSTSNFRCPECVRERDESFLQEKVRLYLESLDNGNYTILHESDCTISPINPRTNNKLFYDNEIQELKLIIEVHGIQHYELAGFHKNKAKRRNITPEKAFHYQKLKDRYKRIYAKSKGYNFIEIPYWTDDEKETWKILINNIINNIKEM